MSMKGGHALISAEVTPRAHLQYSGFGAIKGEELGVTMLRHRSARAWHRGAAGGVCKRPLPLSFCMP